MKLLDKVTGVFTRHRDKVMHFVVGAVIGVGGAFIGLLIALYVGGGYYVLFSIPLMLTAFVAGWKEARDPAHGGTQDSMDFLWTMGGCVTVLLPLAASMVFKWA